ncbi:universal stress protein UspA [Kocuria flava]|uniref:Universal stress protein n=1 Tax=Kocuria flava TaxID=446860 RepID=A0A0U3HDV1_9MICC|nr:MULTISPECIES: universal stress protein [Kocuria]ALU39353.1 universal stress protein UspA [Kocuria flava]MCD1145967.1 universal stress protein [Kocuria sp. LUK]PLC11023.1 universal stress protein UspA [Kocuria flava]GEO93318.1 universal stress protein [Kocuria flava]
MTEPSEDRVLVGIDGSEASQEALRLAARLARALGAPLEAIACAGDPTVLDADLLVDEEALRANHERILARTVAAVFGDDVPPGLRTTVLGGRPAGRLIAESEHAQLLVLGRHGRSGLGARLGSVSNACVAYAHCPVVVVRH